MRYGLQKFFGSQSSCGRAQTGPAHVQTHAGHAQTALESQKTLEGHISLETCPNWAFEVFLASTGNVDAKTPQTPDSDKF